MDKKDFPYAIIVAVLGTLNHFLYKWSNESAIIALFCPVSESVWEHLKLLFFPFLFVSIFAYLRHKCMGTLFFYHRLLAVLLGMLSIITLFYTYTGLIGRSFLIVDILIYFLGVLSSFSFLRHIRRNGNSKIPSDGMVMTLWLILCLCFFLFTCFPPNIPLFFPPDNAF